MGGGGLRGGERGKRGIEGKGRGKEGDLRRVGMALMDFNGLGIGYWII